MATAHAAKRKSAEVTRAIDPGLPGSDAVVAVPDAAMPEELRKRVPVSAGYIPRTLSQERDASGALRPVTDLSIMRLVEKYNASPDSGPRKRNVMLTGPTGTGKTEMVMEFAARRAKPVITVMPAMRPEHLVGQFIEDADGHLVFQKGPLWVAAEMGNCVLYFDEINRVHEDVTPMLYPMLDRRRQLYIYEHGIKAIRLSTGEYLNRFDPNDPDQQRWEGEVIIDLPDDVLIVASYNPGYAGTNILNEAIRNRFEVNIDYSYSDEVETKLIKSSAIRRLASNLRSTELSQGAVTSPVTTNQLRAFQENVRAFGLAFAVASFIDYFEDHERSVVRELINTKYLDTLRQEFGYGKAEA